MFLTSTVMRTTMFLTSKVMHLTPISHLSGFLHVQAATFCFRFERSYSLASAQGQRGDITSQPKRDHIMTYTTNNQKQGFRHLIVGILVLVSLSPSASPLHSEF